jgi:7-carboxy-7-deazaguanine synthase
MQGEGTLTGTESVFVRTSGCNLRCWYCDTPYTSWYPEGEDLAVETICERIMDLGCIHVVLTGGEPMLFAELIPICSQLRQQGKHITIETAGTLHLPLDCDLMSISPKLCNSPPSPDLDPKWHVRHERTREQPDVIRQLVRQYAYQFKFVVGTAEDCAEVLGYLERFHEIDRGRVMLMPLGTDARELEGIGAWLEPYCRQHGLQYCPRKHIEWFGLVRET